MLTSRDQNKKSLSARFLKWQTDAMFFAMLLYVVKKIIKWNNPDKFSWNNILTWVR